jgi:4,5-DOPA dioxygenase extradiol
MSLPSLFISHGSPMLALQPGASGPALNQLAQALPRPEAIVVVSAHWQSTDLRVTHNQQPATWHDFGGFPAALYEVQYPAPGQPRLAEKIALLLGDAGLPAQLDEQRPFDHGTWVPLSLMYPQADIPVVQVSLPNPQTPGIVRQIGQALASLRDEGVLLIGSGSITHNLGELDRQESDDHVVPWAQEFRDWVVDKLAISDLDALLNYRQQAPSAKRSHPSDEHLLPLYFAQGAGGQFKVEHSGFTFGSLGMDIYSFA